MTISDLVTAAVILAAAVWLLYRSVFGRRGGCAGCASACRPPRQELVRLSTGAPPTSPATLDCRSASRSRTH